MTEPSAAFVASRRDQWQDLLCIQEGRAVDNDNADTYSRPRLQMQPHRLRPHFVKAKVRAHHYSDDTQVILHGPPCIARHPIDRANNHRSGQLMCN